MSQPADMPAPLTMTVQEALMAELREVAALRGYTESAELCQQAADALADAERRVTEAEEEMNSWGATATQLFDERAELQSRLSAVEARCGLMRKALEQITLTRLPIEQSIAAAALAADDEQISILAYPGGKSDQGEKPGNYEAQAAIDPAPLSRSGDSALVEARRLLLSALGWLSNESPPQLEKGVRRWLAEHPEVQQHEERK